MGEMGLVGRAIRPIGTKVSHCDFFFTLIGDLSLVPSEPQANRRRGLPVISGCGRPRPLLLSSLAGQTEFGTKMMAACLVK